MAMSAAERKAKQRAKQKANKGLHHIKIELTSEEYEALEAMRAANHLYNNAKQDFYKRCLLTGSKFVRNAGSGNVDNRKSASPTKQEEPKHERQENDLRNLPKRKMEDGNKSQEQPGSKEDSRQGNPERTEAPKSATTDFSNRITYSHTGARTERLFAEQTRYLARR